VAEYKRLRLQQKAKNQEKLITQSTVNKEVKLLKEPPGEIFLDVVYICIMMNKIILALIVFGFYGVCLGAVVVSNTAELETAVSNANSGGDKEIVLQAGTYTLTDMLGIWADGVTVRGQSENRDSVIVQGQGMYGGVSHIFNVAGTDFTVKDMTIGRVSNHAIQIWGNNNSSNNLISNLRIIDTYEQMVKVSYDSSSANSSENGVMENCLLEYTAGVGPQWYIGGIDAHQARNWIVRDNTFKYISSPSGDVAEHAVHFWSGSVGTIVERNIIIDCDRGIGFGLGDRGHNGGIIRNNMIYHSSTNYGYADVAIGLESASGVQVYNNTIYIQHGYSNAIEYRFPATSGCTITNNLCNGSITSRNGGSATLSSNLTNAAASWFTSVSNGDLHLAYSVSQVVDQGVSVPGLSDDIDGHSRPQGAGIDIGADEYGTVSSGNDPPFGSFDTPVNGSTVRSSIAVTGWALDDVAVTSVKIYRDPVAGEEGKYDGLEYIGDADFVKGARPDVAGQYPGYPNNHTAGWGYMLLTNFMPGNGNGTFTLYAIARDARGNRVTLGTKTITCDNANAVKPFGAIDTPTQGGTASGGKFLNWGWVLTPQPYSIPIDGSTINVWVDGVNIGNPTYNLYRSDIATLFPGYANSQGAVGYFYLDTEAYANGVHTIQWTADDTGGNSDGIGSRYFSINNAGGSRVGAKGPGKAMPAPGKKGIDRTPVVVLKGFDSDIQSEMIMPDQGGVIDVEMKELGRLEIRFRTEVFLCLDGAPDFRTLSQTPLPVGSTLDEESNVFYWQPGPGFAGDYEFIFLDALTGYTRTVRVKILPKFSH
jgi:hypothetical protein